jgi:hypothetical protein
MEVAIGDFAKAWVDSSKSKPSCAGLENPCDAERSTGTNRGIDPEVGPGGIYNAR